MPIEISYDKSIINDLDHFTGKPFLMKIHLDGENEAEMQFNPDWVYKDIVDAIHQSMKKHSETSGIVKHIHIVDVREIISHKN